MGFPDVVCGGDKGQRNGHKGKGINLVNIQSEEKYIQAG